MRTHSSLTLVKIFGISLVVTQLSFISVISLRQHQLVQQEAIELEAFKNDMVLLLNQTKSGGDSIEKSCADFQRVLEKNSTASTKYRDTVQGAIDLCQNLGYWLPDKPK